MVRVPGPPRAVVIVVGDELLLGQTSDTNGTWLAGNLSELGFEVQRLWAVPDRVSEIRDAVARALETAAIVLVTGGLGPTSDDLTKEAVAGLLGLRLEVRPELLHRLRERFRERGHPTLPRGSEAMAEVPSGARTLTNPLGAAPGLVLEPPSGGICILLPGVPREMQALFRDGVVPFLRERFGGYLEPTLHRTIHTFGIPESLLAEKIASVLPSDLGGVSLAYLPGLGGVRLRLTTRARSGEEEASAALERMEKAIETVVAPFRYRAESGRLAEAVGRALLDRDCRLGVAESCTGGMIARMVTDIPGSSAYFLGGVVAYANDVKTKVLGVPEASLQREGAVSQAVARGMAAGVASLLGCEAGIGVTGVAGPEGGTKEKPVGTVWYAAVVGDRDASRREVFPGDREGVRVRASRASLFLLLRLLEGRVG